MLALIDLDPILYEYGSCCFPDGNPMPGYMVEQFVHRKIEHIVERSGATDWRGYLTYGPDNFRFEVATIKDYKGNRKDKEKPPLYEHIKGFLLSDYPDKVELVFGQEADDAVSIRQYKNMDSSDTLAGDHPDFQSTVICTIDKDLDMVPGWHYRWSKGDVKEIEPWYQDVLGGLKCFYKQCLTGDSVDNIPGLRGIGPKSAYLTSLDKCEDKQQLFDIVRELYGKWYGNYGDQFLLEVGRLLWMRSKENELWSFPNEV